MNAFTSFMKGLFDDPDWTEDEPEALANNVVAELLPYRVYDPESELYYNENSTGFIIEVNPVVGWEWTKHGGHLRRCGPC